MLQGSEHVGILKRFLIVALLNGTFYGELRWYKTIESPPPPRHAISAVAKLRTFFKSKSHSKGWSFDPEQRESVLWRHPHLQNSRPDRGPLYPEIRRQQQIGGHCRWRQLHGNLIEPLYYFFCDVRFDIKTHFVFHTNFFRSPNRSVK